MEQCYLRYLLNAFYRLRCLNGHFKNTKERNSFLLFSPTPKSHPAPLSCRQGKKKELKMVVYPTRKFGTHGAFSQWCFSAGLKPRAGFKLQPEKDRALRFGEEAGEDRLLG